MAELERTDKEAISLVRELKTGVLGVPEIQRDYVWKVQQAIDLLDSMYRQYPIGLILLWKPSKLPKLRSDNAINPNYLILDGQQRITTLEKVFDNEIHISFNVKDDVFQKTNNNLTLNSYWISVNEVFDDAFSVIGKLKNIHNLTNDEQNSFYSKLEKIKNIKNYRFPVMIMLTDDYDEITESFIRLNSQGTRLRKTELAMAKLAYHWPGSIINEFSSAISAFEKIGFKLETSFFMRCFLAIGRASSSVFGNLDSIWKLSEQELEYNWKKTKIALELAINFLKNNAGIESSTLLTSEILLIPLAFFFYKKESSRISDREINGLLLWFFVTLVFGRYSGRVNQIDKDIKDINTETPIDNLLNNLKHDMSSFYITPEMLKGSYYNNKFLPLMFVIAKNKSACDWFSGISLSAVSIGGHSKIQKHHIFPKNYIRKKSDFVNFDTKEVNDLANIAFLTQHANIDILDKDPSDYLKKIDRQRLEDQFIPNYPELWKIERYQDFCNERRKLISNEINIYFDRLLKAIS